MGPAEYGLEELLLSDSRFAEAVSYRRYRLVHQIPHLKLDILRYLGVWTRRLRHSMEKNIFDGKNTAVASYKRACDAESVPELAPLHTAPLFLDGNGRYKFESIFDDANGGFGGFNTWPHAVRFLLETYASDKNIEETVQKLEEM